MPWYWSDDIARVLTEMKSFDVAKTSKLTATPVAFRSPAETIEAAVEILLDDDEIPLAA